MQDASLGLLLFLPNCSGRIKLFIKRNVGRAGSQREGRAIVNNHALFKLNVYWPVKLRCSAGRRD